MELNKFPNLVLVSIFKNIDCNDLQNISIINKKFNCLSKKHCWKLLCSRDYNNLYNELPIPRKTPLWQRVYFYLKDKHTIYSYFNFKSRFSENFRMVTSTIIYKDNREKCNYDCKLYEYSYDNSYICKNCKYYCKNCNCNCKNYNCKRCNFSYVFYNYNRIKGCIGNINNYSCAICKGIYKSKYKFFIENNGKYITLTAEGNVPHITYQSLSNDIMKYISYTFPTSYNIKYSTDDIPKYSWNSFYDIWIINTINTINTPYEFFYQPEDKIYIDSDKQNIYEYFQNKLINCEEHIIFDSNLISKIKEYHSIFDVNFIIDIIKYKILDRQNVHLYIYYDKLFDKNINWSILGNFYNCIFILYYYKDNDNIYIRSNVDDISAVISYLIFMFLSK